MQARYINSSDTFSLSIMAYCGMRLPIIDRDDMATCRQKAARHLRSLRRDGFPVRTVEQGTAWEIEEPADSVMVPDTCGTMRIKPVSVPVYSCSECDSDILEGESCSSCENMEEYLRDMADRDEEEAGCRCVYPCMCHLNEREEEEAVPPIMA